MNRTLAALALTMSVLSAACSSSASDSADDQVDTTTTVESDDGGDLTTETTEAGETETTDDGAESAATGATGATDGTAFSCDETAAQFVTKGSANADLADPEVAATCEGDSVVITANGIPDYTYIATSPGDPDAVDLTFTIPAEPTVAVSTTDVPDLGTAAVALNGVPIYGPTEGTGGDVLSLDGALSECGSHNGPTGFHIHLFGTSDSTDCIFTTAEVEAEPQLLGYALDGYPIYTGNDQYTSSWELTDESLFATDTWSAHSYVEGSGDLDQCNGLTDADGNYAYYTTDTFPYIIGCYTGTVDLDAAGGGGGGAGPGQG